MPWRSGGRCRRLGGRGSARSRRTAEMVAAPSTAVATAVEVRSFGIVMRSSVLRRRRRLLESESPSAAADAARGVRPHSDGASARRTDRGATSGRTSLRVDRTCDQPGDVPQVRRRVRPSPGTNTRPAQSQRDRGVPLRRRQPARRRAHGGHRARGRRLALRGGRRSVGAQGRRREPAARGGAGLPRRARRGPGPAGPPARRGLRTRCPCPRRPPRDHAPGLDDPARRRPRPPDLDVAGLRDARPTSRRTTRRCGWSAPTAAGTAAARRRAGRSRPPWRHGGPRRPGRPTHLGGHRFAGTLLALPSGRGAGPARRRFRGRGVQGARGRPGPARSHARGRAGLAPVVQVAELHARAELGARRTPRRSGCARWTATRWCSRAGGVDWAVEVEAHPDRAPAAELRRPGDQARLGVPRAVMGTAQPSDTTTHPGGRMTTTPEEPLNDDDMTTVPGGDPRSAWAAATRTAPTATRPTPTTATPATATRPTPPTATPATVTRTARTRTAPTRTAPTRTARTATPPTRPTGTRPERTRPPQR